MLAVFELLLAWYRFGFLGRSPTPLAIASMVRHVSHFFPSRPLPGFQKTLGPRCKMLLHPFLTFIHLCAQVSWVLACYVLPEGAGKKLEVSQFFFVPFQEASRRFRVTISLSERLSSKTCICRAFSSWSACRLLSESSLLRIRCTGFRTRLTNLVACGMIFN